MATHVLTNRERRLKPKLAKSWCDGCDRYFDSALKCPVCGYKHPNRRLKKDTNA